MKNLSKAASALGKRGALKLIEKYGIERYEEEGLRTLKKLGKEHYKRISKLGVAARKLKAEQYGKVSKDEGIELGKGNR